MSEVDDAVGPLDDLLATRVQPWADFGLALEASAQSFVTFGAEEMA
jgi:hypothetical protein